MIAADFAFLLNSTATVKQGRQKALYQKTESSPMDRYSFLFGKLHCNTLFSVCNPHIFKKTDFIAKYRYVRRTARNRASAPRFRVTNAF